MIRQSTLVWGLRIQYTYAEHTLPMPVTALFTPSGVAVPPIERLPRRKGSCRSPPPPTMASITPATNATTTNVDTCQTGMSMNSCTFFRSSTCAGGSRGLSHQLYGSVARRFRRPAQWTLTLLEEEVILYSMQSHSFEDHIVVGLYSGSVRLQLLDRCLDELAVVCELQVASSADRVWRVFHADPEDVDTAVRLGRVGRQTAQCTGLFSSTCPDVEPFDVLAGTVRHPIRMNSQIIFLSAFVTSHATISSKSPVNPDPGRTKGTPSATSPCSGQRTLTRRTLTRHTRPHRSRCRHDESTSRVS